MLAHPVANVATGQKGFEHVTRGSIDYVKQREGKTYAYKQQYGAVKSQMLQRFCIAVITQSGNDDVLGQHT